MIAYLRGNVWETTQESVILLVNGVGYELLCSAAAFRRVEGKKTDVGLYTYLQVKEDGVTLFGFASAGEKRTFLDLISVSGVGPKMGIAILSALSAEEVAECIATADAKRLSRVKGLGKKTAEKIILELHGKISAEELLEDKAATGVKKAPPAAEDEEALQALSGLGFSRAESVSAVERAKNAGAKGLEEILRLALSGM